MTDLLTPEQVFEMYQPIIEAWTPEMPGAVAPPMLGMVGEDGKLLFGPVFGQMNPSEYLNMIDPTVVAPGIRVVQAIFVIEAHGEYGVDEEHAMERDVVLFYSATAPDVIGGTWAAFSPMVRTVTADEQGEAGVSIEWTEPGDENAPPMIMDFDEYPEEIPPVIQDLRRFVTGGPTEGALFPPPSPN